MIEYNFMIVGAGLFGSVFAQRAAEKGKRCLVIDRRSTVGGNLHCDTVEGIQVHKYGTHIFYTDDHSVWEYVNRFARFNNYIYSPMVMCGNELYNLPFNMNLFKQLWGTITPSEAMERVRKQTAAENIGIPQNMEELCLKNIGRELYEKFMKGYIEKRTGVPCREMPPNKDLLFPLRFVYDNRFYNTPFQGVPVEGYDVMIKRMLAGSEVMLNTEYLGFGVANKNKVEKVIYTGMIDEFFRFKRGSLEYKTLSFKSEVLDMPNYQGNAIINYSDSNVPYTRIIEHKHFQFGNQPKTVITYEQYMPWHPGREPFYPLSDQKNLNLYNSYRALAVAQPDVVFCGRLGTYKYYNMAETVKAALQLADSMIK